LPPITANFTSELITKAKKLSDDYVRLAGKESPENYKDFLDFFPELKN
jgi:hypothetical protein